MAPRTVGREHMREIDKGVIRVGQLGRRRAAATG